MRDELLSNLGEVLCVPISAYPTLSCFPPKGLVFDEEFVQLLEHAHAIPDQ
jgi:hypothetical protein